MSIAGLAPVQPVGVPIPVQSATVIVGPPLSANPAGSSSGFVLHLEVPVGVGQARPVKPQLVPSSMLCPPSVIVPLRSPQFTKPN
jgi:hypothetical protein